MTLSPQTSEDVWQRIAKRYLERVDMAPYNALYERPCLVALLPSMRSQRVLDLGFGSGFFLDLALANGAKTVTGVDQSAEMVQACALRMGSAANLVRADLRGPLCFLHDDSIDVAIASLLIHYLPDLKGFASELARVLAPGGTLIISTSHPLADFEESPSQDYFLTEEIAEEWSSYGITMPSYRRPLEDLLGSFTRCGFLVDAVVEPRPLARMATTHPETYRKLMRRPGFICIRYRKVI